MPLRIAEINNLWFGIPPKKYGGAERIVHSLVEGLVKLGHDVTFYGPKTSKTSAKLVSVVDIPLFELGLARKETLYPLLNIVEAMESEENYDILHFHLNVASDYLALPLALPIINKVLFTIHFTAPSLKRYEDRDKVLKKYKNLNFISISNAQRKGMEHLNWIKTIYNGINLNEFTFNPHPKDYLVWMGKFNPDKGTKEAIEVAKKANVKLKLAGAIDEQDGIDRQYYYEEIKPLIDNEQIIYVGEVGGKEKDELLNQAKAFLNPIQWNEPFGLVIAESLAAGTPVISLNNGAACELIKNGETGFIVQSLDEMVKKIKRIDSIDRLKCRQHVEAHFSNVKMVNEYTSIFHKLLNKTLTQ